MEKFIRATIMRKAEAYSFLRQRLISGHYGPGNQLKEEHIAEELGISRTPVRAALQQLVQDGLVVSAANRGMFVAEWTDHDILDVWSLRLVLEPHAAALAAERAGKRQIESMRAANARLLSALNSDRKNRIAEMQDANLDFHSLIIEAARSPRLRAAALQTVDTPLLLGTYYIMDEKSILRSFNHHEDIIAVIEARDSEAASKAMWLHLRISVNSFMQKRGSSTDTRVAGHSDRSGFSDGY